MYSAIYSLFWLIYSYSSFYVLDLWPSPIPQVTTPAMLFSRLQHWFSLSSFCQIQPKPNSNHYFFTSLYRNLLQNSFYYLLFTLLFFSPFLNHFCLSFWPHPSMDTVLVNVTNDHLFLMPIEQLSMLLICNLSAEFNTNHQFLSYVLSSPISWEPLTSFSNTPFISHS